MSHLTYTTLIGYIGSRLSDSEHATVEQHLFSPPCERCTRMLVRLRAVLESLAADQSTAPPEAVLRRAIEAFRKAEKSPARLRARVAAGLQFDSRVQMSAAASRGAGRSRHLLFSAEEVDIDLQIAPERGEHRLVGQILTTDHPNRPSPAFVSLQNGNGESLRATETNQQGQFTFSQIPSGVYDLVFERGTQEVVVIGLELVNDA